MPTICVFFGIVIRMYFDEHAPAHFHAYYGEHSALIDLGTLEILEGALPKRALALVQEWAAEHQSELRDNWDRAVAHRPLVTISPLE